MAQLTLFLLLIAIGTIAGLAGKLLFAFSYPALHNDLSTSQLFATLLWGLRFDLAVAAQLALIVYLFAYLLFRTAKLPFQRTLPLAGLLVIALLVAIQGGDLVYYGVSGRHLGYELKETLNSGGALALSALTSYREIVLLALSLQLIISLAGFTLLRFTAQRLADTPFRSAKPEIQLLLAIVIGAFFSRGGVQIVPLEPLHAQEIGSTNRATLALNGAYNAIFSSATGYAISPVIGSAEAEDYELVTRLYPTSEPVALPSPSRKNVIIVFLESWSAAHMASYFGSDAVTPHFDQFREAGISSWITLAGGSRTTEGLFATLCSAQNPLGGTIAQTQLQNYDYDCLPEFLGANGYISAFFQGSLANTSGTGAFAKTLGFQQSYGSREYEAHRFPENSWGYHDPDIYDAALTWMKAQNQPVLLGINTNSTHDNQLPDGVAPLLPESDRVSQYKNILHFADGALGEFLANLRNASLWDNSIVVLVADHIGKAPESPLLKYAVPLAIGGGGIERRYVDGPSSQRDIAPTVQNLLGFPTSPWYAGISLLQETPDRFADYYHAGRLGWLTATDLQNILVKNTQRIQCYNPRADWGMNHSTPCGEGSQLRAEIGIAFTRVQQTLLFAGKLNQFQQIRP